MRCQQLSSNKPIAPSFVFLRVPEKRADNMLCPQHCPLDHSPWSPPVFIMFTFFLALFPFFFSCPPSFSLSQKKKKKVPRTAWFFFSFLLFLCSFFHSYLTTHHTSASLPQQQRKLTEDSPLFKRRSFSTTKKPNHLCTRTSFFFICISILLSQSSFFFSNNAFKKRKTSLSLSYPEWLQLWKPGTVTTAVDSQSTLNKSNTTNWKRRWEKTPFPSFSLLLFDLATMVSFYFEVFF